MRDAPLTRNSSAAAWVTDKKEDSAGCKAGHPFRYAYMVIESGFQSGDMNDIDAVRTSLFPPFPYMPDTKFHRKERGIQGIFAKFICVKFEICVILTGFA